MSELGQAWTTAASDLGIRVVVPYALRDRDGVVLADAFLPDFGSSAGAVIVAIGAGSQVLRRAAASMGAFYSELSLDAYSPYERSLYVETLEDWGWTNVSEAPPEWMQ